MNELYVLLEFLELELKRKGNKKLTILSLQRLVKKSIKFIEENEEKELQGLESINTRDF